MVLYNNFINRCERMQNMNKEYLKNIYRLLEKIEATQEQAIDRVAAICAESIYNGGLLYFFGTGHSHMICEEPFLPCRRPCLCVSHS